MNDQGEEDRFDFSVIENLFQVNAIYNKRMTISPSIMNMMKLWGVQPYNYKELIKHVFNTILNKIKDDLKVIDPLLKSKIVFKLIIKTNFDVMISRDQYMPIDMFMKYIKE